MPHLLLIDDDRALIPEQVRQAFVAPSFRVTVAGDGADGVDRTTIRPIHPRQLRCSPLHYRQ
jgi:DNA-binding response OmpR family regulator